MEQSKNESAKYMNLDGTPVFWQKCRFVVDTLLASTHKVSETIRLCERTQCKHDGWLNYAGIHSPLIILASTLGFFSSMRI